MRKAREIAILILFNLLAIVLIVVVFDLIFSPYRRLPKDGEFDGRQYTWGHLVENNRFGFRERDFETPKPAGVYRIMVLGDSFTWGEGLAVEDRYTDVAETLLNQANTDFQFEVLNFGVRGASTEQERRLLRNHLREVQPDLIVIGFTLNDPQPEEMNYSPERGEIAQKGGRLVKKIAQVFYGVGLRFTGESIYNAFYAIFERSGAIPTWETALDRAYDPGSQEWQDFLYSLGAIKEMSDRKDRPGPIFAILNQGVSTTEPTDYGNPDEYLEVYLRWYHQAEAAAREAGYLVYNHEQEIAERLNDQPLTVNTLDYHPSAALNQVYGEKLFKVIAELLEIEITSH